MQGNENDSRNGLARASPGTVWTSALVLPLRRKEPKAIFWNGRKVVSA